MTIDFRPLPPLFLRKLPTIFIHADSHLTPLARQYARSQRLPLLVVALGIVAHLGCAFFPSSTNRSVSTRNRFLPPLQASPDSILLEVFFIERPAEDRLLTTGIWKEVDESGAAPSETREILRENGFRLGYVSSNPPPAVQRLLGMVAEIPTETPENSRPLMGRHQYQPPGGDAEISTGIEYDHCDFLLRDKDRDKTLEYDRVSCVLRMKAHRLEDGWVRVDFQPEIHHGAKQMRPIPTDEGWGLRGGQNVDVLHAQRFSVSMNVGEMALITSTSDDDGTLGDRFFCHEDRGMKRQRVLIVRIIDSGKSP